MRTSLNYERGIMILIDLPIKSDVPLVAPADSCCNCGSTSNITMEATDLHRMPLMGMVGAQINVALPFPYCQTCVSTARRKRPNALGIVAISTLLALLLGMAWIFLGPQTSEDTTLHIVAPVVVVLSLAIIAAFYAMRRASGSQTSYYQPIMLKNTGHKWPADITGLELAFTNAQYAARFASANRAAIDAMKLKVSNA
jgi:hypothetical protein